MKRIAQGVALIALAIAVVLGTMRAGLWNPSYEEVRAAQVTTPSTFEKVVAQKGVDRFAKAVTQFKAAKVDVIHYPDVGHYPMLELPTDTARDLRQWFDKVLK
ncbi:alpha/beta fold hydrolase [Novosphingobium sp.]|jgi:alpha-beta hydrolase superfamily lysophospholipase|uniref:alpha/beta fold hydrolase n=1 Tax=Novosphingobium sp. TaxID=1874826 RepID=UPI003564011A